jgi:SpoU rRNA methylase family enzyme
MERWSNNIKKLPLSYCKVTIFFVEDLMDALGVVYPQYWLPLKPKKRVQCSFDNHQSNTLLSQEDET